MARHFRFWTAMAAAMALGVGVTIAVGRAQQRTATLTPQDYIDIQQLLARYSDAVDSCSNNGYDYADLYTSRVSNFGPYSPLRYFRAPRRPMPHEI